MLKTSAKLEAHCLTPDASIATTASPGVAPHETGWLIRTDTAGDLRQIHRPEVSLVVWQRRLHGAIDAWLDRLAFRRLPCGQVLVGRADTDAAVRDIFAESGTPATAQARLLADDIVRMTGLFADIAGIDTIDIRLDAIRHDACWRFHRDAVPLRLLATYRGPATEIVPPEHTDRAQLAQRAYDGPLEKPNRHAAALFKGSHDAVAGGVVHRSPPIGGSGVVRLLLCLNLPSATSPTLWHPDNRQSR